MLAFARALGEFGATLFLAGNYLGVTRTIPIAIYFEWMNGNDGVAWFWTAIIIGFSFVVILFINLWSARTTKYRKRELKEEKSVSRFPSKKRFPAFTLDVDIDAGSETLGFLGASGCGKSLTMRCIAGIETPDEGRIVVNGRVFFDSEKKINLTPQQRKTALLFQNYMLFPNLAVAQNVAAGVGRDVAKSEARSIVQGELKRFGFEGFDGRYPSQLSGGQQQRVALARMLAARPGILMLDEPFSAALDSHLKGVSSRTSSACSTPSTAPSST